MPVSITGLGIAFDQRIRRNRHRPGIALIEKSSERHVDFGLCPRNDLVRDAEALVVERSGAKIGMKSDRRADKVNDVCRVRIHRRGRDIGVPETARGERNKSVEAGSSTQAHSAAGTALSKSSSARSNPDQARGKYCKNMSHISPLL